MATPNRLAEGNRHHVQLDVNFVREEILPGLGRGLALALITKQAIKLLRPFLPIEASIQNWVFRFPHGPGSSELSFIFYRSVLIQYVSGYSLPVVSVAALLFRPAQVALGEYRFPHPLNMASAAVVCLPQALVGCRIVQQTQKYRMFWVALFIANCALSLNPNITQFHWIQKGVSFVLNVMTIYSLSGKNNQDYPLTRERLVKVCTLFSLMTVNLAKPTLFELGKFAVSFLTLYAFNTPKRDGEPPTRAHAFASLIAYQLWLDLVSFNNLYV